MNYFDYVLGLEKASSDVFTHAGINYDNRNGLGAVPYNAYTNAIYRGFIVHMRPTEFLDLTPPINPSEKDLEFLVNALNNKEAIASPFLTIEKDDHKVAGHEGRHRMHAILKVLGNVPVVTHIQFIGIRARDVTVEDIRKVRDSLRKQRSGRLITGPLFEKVVDFQGEKIDVTKR